MGRLGDFDIDMYIGIGIVTDIDIDIDTDRNIIGSVLFLLAVPCQPHQIHETTITRTMICLKCHQQEKFETRNNHKQYDLLEILCCHATLINLCIPLQRNISDDCPHHPAQAAMTLSMGI